MTKAIENKTDTFVLILLYLYVLLLGMGVIGELFDVEWILGLPLFTI